MDTSSTETCPCPYFKHYNNGVGPLRDRVTQGMDGDGDDGGGWVGWGVGVGVVQPQQRGIYFLLPELRFLSLLLRSLEDRSLETSRALELLRCLEGSLEPEPDVRSLEPLRGLEEGRCREVDAPGSPPLPSLDLEEDLWWRSPLAEAEASLDRELRPLLLLLSPSSLDLRWDRRDSPAITTATGAITFKSLGPDGATAFAMAGVGTRGAGAARAEACSSALPLLRDREWWWWRRSPFASAFSLLLLLRPRLACSLSLRSPDLDLSASTERPR